MLEKTREVNNTMNRKRIAAWLMAVCMAATLTACSGGEDAPAASGDGSRVEVQAEEGKVSSITPDVFENVQAMEEINPDTVGWLSIPDTIIADAVLHKPDDETNNYYLRKDYNGDYYFNGVYYADFRAAFGNGTREDLGVNTCIYGHAITDNPEEDEYDIKFGPLHDFRDEEFARKHPYIYFSTGAESMVFEVVAVFMANADNPDLPYNSNPSGADFVKMFEEEIKPRSIYNYDTEVTEEDKFITLSTCIYEMDVNGEKITLPYPDTFFRYAVMAKLVDPEDELKTEAAFTVNEDVLIDPDGRWTAA